MITQKILESKIANCKFSEALPMLEIICKQNNFKMCNLRDYAKAAGILIKSQILN